MAEADFSPVTVHMSNTLRDKVAAFGRERKILKKVKTYSLEGVNLVDTVNMSESLNTIVEEYFEIQAQKVRL